MKKLLIYIYILAFAASFTACEKEIMDYEGVDGLYFDVRWGEDIRSPDQWAHQYYTPVEFGTMTANTYTVQLRVARSEEHTSELQSRSDLVCRLLLEKKKKRIKKKK